MNREFFINISFLILINGLIKPLYLFGIDRTVQNVVAPGEYGLFFELFSFAYLLQIVADFGIQNFNNRTIAQHQYLLGKYFPNILLLKGLLALLYAFLVLVIGAWIGYLNDHPFLLILVLSNQLLLSLTLFLRSNISGLGMYRLDSALSVLDKLLLTIGVGTLLLIPSVRVRFQIEWYVVGQTIAWATTALVCLGIILRRIPRMRFKFRPALLLMVLKQSYPFALIIFLMTLYTRIDAVMIGRLLPNGKLEADLYASAYRLLDAANVLGYLFAGLLLPIFSSMLIKKQAVNSLVAFSLQLIWAGAIPVAFSIIGFRQSIMESLYVNGSAYSGNMLGLLMLSFIALTGSSIYGTLLTANGSLMRMNRIFITGVLANILLNALLIPAYQALGAAIATCLTQFFVFIGQVILAQKLVPLRSSPKLVGRILLFSVLTAGISYGAGIMGAPVAWYWMFSLSIVLGGITAFGIGMIKVPVILELLKRPE